MAKAEKSMVQVIITIILGYGSLIMACVNEFYYHKPLDALVFVFIINAMFLRSISQKLNKRTILYK